MNLIMAKNASRKIRITNRSYIAPLCQHGPIVTPIYVDESSAYKLVQRGYNVIEVDPLTSKECVLSIDNFFKSNRFGSDSNKKPVSNTAITGKQTMGQAIPVRSIAKNAAVPISDIINSSENGNKLEESENKQEEKPVVPFINNQMSKAERRALARQKREEEAKAKADTEVKTEQ